MRKIRFFFLVWLHDGHGGASMSGLETSVIIPLIILIVLMQVIGLSFFLLAQIQTSESLEIFYQDSGEDLLNYIEIVGLRIGPFHQSQSFSQLRTSGWDIVRWGIVASDLTRMITGRVLP